MARLNLQKRTGNDSLGVIRISENISGFVRETVRAFANYLFKSIGVGFWIVRGGSETDLAIELKLVGKKQSWNTLNSKAIALVSTVSGMLRN